MPSRARLILGGAAVAVVLAAGSTLAIATATGGFRTGRSAPNGRCSAPALPGTVVDVALTNMGGPMMGRGPMMGGMMRVRANRDRVRAGTVSLRVANTGSLVHELVVLPLAEGEHPGARQVGSDGWVDETASVGEASRSCGEGAGDGIDAGSLSWVTLELEPGDYELICNLPGHYAAGMYTRIHVG